MKNENTIISMNDLQELQQKIAAAKKPPEPNEGALGRKDSGASVAINMAAELLATVLVGGAIGYFTDAYLHTNPIGLIIGLLLGMTAGIIAIKRINDSYVMTIKNDEESEK